MPETRKSKIEQLKAQLDELKMQMLHQGNQVNPFVIPDPIKNYVRIYWQSEGTLRVARRARRNL